MLITKQGESKMSLLSSIISIKDLSFDGTVIIFYGNAGVGKTSLASTFDKPFFLMCENGALSIKNDYPDVMTTPDVIRSYDEFMNWLRDIYKADKLNFKTLVIDSITVLEELLTKHLSTQHNKEELSDIGYGKGYNLLQSYTIKHLNALLQIRDKHKIDIIMLAHSENTVVHEAGEPSYERIDISVHKKTRVLYQSKCDFVNLLSVERYIGNNGKSVSSDGKRRLLWLSDTSANCKNRIGKEGVDIIDNKTRNIYHVIKEGVKGKKDVKKV